MSLAIITVGDGDHARRAAALIAAHAAVVREFRPPQPANSLAELKLAFGKETKPERAMVDEVLITAATTDYLPPKNVRPSRSPKDFGMRRNRR